VRRLTSHGLSSLVLGSALWCALYGARVFTSGRFIYGFLLWNLFLAWVPWVLALAADSALRRGWRVVAVGLVAGWIAFLPNAPYVLTDFLHLRSRAGVPLWFDVLLLGTASLTGLLAGAFSLRRMEDALDERLPTWLVRGGLALAIVAAGFGIYLGRFERLNSWDLVLHPLEVLARVLEAPGRRALVVTVACAGLLGTTYLAVRERRSEANA